MKARGIVPIEAGLITRRQVRRFLQLTRTRSNGLGISWTEDKGLLDSYFVVTAIGEEDVVKRWLKMLEVEFPE